MPVRIAADIPGTLPYRFTRAEIRYRAANRGLSLTAQFSTNTLVDSYNTARFAMLGTAAKSGTEMKFGAA